MLIDAHQQYFFCFDTDFVADLDQFILASTAMQTLGMVANLHDDRISLDLPDIGSFRYFNIPDDTPQSGLW